MSDGDFFEKIGTGVRTINSSTPSVIVEKPSLREIMSDFFGVTSEKQPDVMNDGDTKSTRNWAISDNLYFEIKSVAKKIPAGLYSVTETNRGKALQQLPVNTDELIIPIDNTITSIIDEFKLFWERKPFFSKRGLLHKRGFLLYGPAGSGKTCLIRLLSKELINSLNGVIIKVDHPGLAIEGISIFRRVEPDRPLILLMEDLDSLVEMYGESAFLSLLDGEDQFENIVAIATTNYPERLDSRLVNRPSRFDKIILIDMPNDDYRRQFIKNREPEMEEEELNKWVAASDRFSLAHLKEMIVAIKCLNQPFDEVVKRLSRMKQKPKSKGETSIGFTD